LSYTQFKPNSLALEIIYKLQQVFKAGNIQYRNCNLTRYLTGSFGESSNLVIIGCISSKETERRTKDTFEFIAICKYIKSRPKETTTTCSGLPQISELSTPVMANDAEPQVDSGYNSFSPTRRRASRHSKFKNDESQLKRFKIIEALASFS